SLYFKSLKDSPAFSSIAYLYNPGNGSVTSFYLDSDSSVKLPYTGTYLLAVSGQSAANSSVSYSFEVFDNLSPSSTLTLGTGVSGPLANPGDSHTYTFTGAVGQRIYYDGLASGGTYLFAQLADPYGNALFNTSSSTDEGPYTLKYAGTYTLTVYSY